VPFAGALQHAPSHVVQRWCRHERYRPAFADDLEMVVRSVFHSLSISSFEEICGEQREDIIIGFWHHHLKPAFWADMLAAARRVDYGKLKDHIRAILG
jgi:hypothetical protein